MCNYVMVGWEGGDYSGKDLWILYVVFQWYQQWQLQILLNNFFAERFFQSLFCGCFAGTFASHSVSDFLSWHVELLGSWCFEFRCAIFFSWFAGIYFQLDACQLALLSRQVRLIICWCSSFRKQYHWDDWIGSLQQSSTFFGDLAPIQLRSRPTQPFIWTGWVVAVPCAQPWRGSFRSSMDSQYFSLDWIAMEIFWLLYNRKVLTLALDTTCCVHDISMDFTGSSLHLLEGCAWDITTGYKKVREPSERLSQPFHVWLMCCRFYNWFTWMSVHVSCNYSSGCLQLIVGVSFHGALFVGASRWYRVSFPLYWSPLSSYHYLV